jgi:hypothetical protein
MVSALNPKTIASLYAPTFCFLFVAHLVRLIVMHRLIETGAMKESLRCAVNASKYGLARSPSCGLGP